ncbi:MAG: glycosyltransferase family 4 protein [Acidobacteria bacterium]|nr:glycosyltransferase family 4 protein [Acidobacteriota bacterium]
MRLLIVTDVFPPICGGSGWSAYELARGLRARGHELTIVRPRLGNAAIPDEFDGFRPITVFAPAPGIPFVRNWFRNEQYWPRFAEALGGVIREHQIELVHAQHALSGPPSVTAARAAGIPSVCTIRDYWPLCYWTDLMLNPAVGTVCPECTPGQMSHCVRPRAGAAWPLATPFIPYMRANLRRKRQALAKADALIAISHAVAKTLRNRLEEPEATDITTIPNPVDAPAIRAETEQSGSPDRGSYVLFAGKLAANKGASALLPVTADLGLPLVVAGDGPARAGMEAEAHAARREVRFLGWLERPELLRWMRHAALLVFPSTWPEPLGRVLIEASALGCPIVAMDTGGVSDVVVDGETGLLARTVDELRAHARRLRHDPDLAARLGAAARRRVDAVFDTEVVAEQHEDVYGSLVERCARATGEPA